MDGERRGMSPEEEDLMARSIKKVKGGDHTYSNDSSIPLSYADLEANQPGDGLENVRSYRDSVLGQTSKTIPADGGIPTAEGENKSQHDDWSYDLSSMQLSIIEKKRGDYECPEIVIPPRQEDRICRPWRKGLIVKLLGRKIGYKALENRLQQMWVRKGALSLVDLGNDYFLVYLSHEEDQAKALTDGPWLIYDHYLTVREWVPNFRPEKGTIDRVAVWVRIRELPIEYYDADFLDFVGNRIGRTIKVDKNTMAVERGKYARICVEIDLDKPLLPMFEIKQHIYKVEYEGLHFLCRNCGKFGHYMEGCPVKINGEREEVHTDPQGKHGNVSEAREGPWMVVQKPKWQKRGKETISTVAVGGGRVLPASLRAATTTVGSRFGILGSDPNNPEALISHDGDSGVLAEIEGNSSGVCASGKAGVLNSIASTRGKNKGKNLGPTRKLIKTTRHRWPHKNM